MALPELRGTGRLLAAPRTGTTSTDKPWTSALIKFPQWRKVDGQWEEGEGTVASVMAYDDNAQLLARYRKGDDVGVHGTCRAAVYKDKPQLAVTVSQLWTPEKANRGSRPSATASNSNSGGSTAGLAEARAAAAAHLRQFDTRRKEQAA